VRVAEGKWGDDIFPDGTPSGLPTPHQDWGWRVAGVLFLATIITSMGVREQWVWFVGVGACAAVMAGTAQLDVMWRRKHIR
jgi:hypothetical protein